MDYEKTHNLEKGRGQIIKSRVCYTKEFELYMKAKMENLNQKNKWSELCVRNIA